MSVSDLPTELVEAYRRTEYRIHAGEESIVLRIGEPSGGARRLIEECGNGGATFITAENPYSRPQTVVENLARQASLRADLTRIGASILEGAGHGQDPTWPPEASYFAVGVTRAQACELGRKYQQNAIVWIGRESIPELLMLR